MEDNFLTIDNECSGVYREKGSKFIAYAFPCGDVAAFEERLVLLKKEHPKARHHCYAYILDPSNQQYRYNDDGEPTGSAGLPIYNQLKSMQLKKIAVVVIRYFGGKKLGVPGLINAYREATQDALSQAKIVEKYVEDLFEISFRFDQTGLVMRVINAAGIRVLENGFHESPYLIFAVRQSLSRDVKVRMYALLLSRNVSDITGDEMIPGFKF
nr:YigZ family protein [Saprospiraceae bacterium]